MMNCSKARTLALGAAALLTLAISGCGGSGTSTTTIPVTAITVYYGHSAAFDHSSSVTTWGYNGSGQLGNGYTSTDYTLQHPQENSQKIKASGLALGEAHTLVFFNNSSVHAWGSNFFGELGNNSTANAVLTPVQVLYKVNPADTTAVPLKKVTAVAAGVEFSMALTSDGTVYTWGLNSSGQLGTNGALTNSTIAVPVAVDALGTQLTGVTAIAAGAAHALVLKQDGTVWSWGNNNSGQLGIGNTSSSTFPQQVLKSDGTPLTNITMIAAGGSSSYAVDASHQIWVWGYDGFGQLGLDPANSANLMVTRAQTLSGITGTVSDISAGIGHLLVQTQEGGIWGLGFNFYGQLGPVPSAALFQDTFAPQQLDLTQFSGGFGTFVPQLTVDGKHQVLAVGRHSMVRTSTGLWTWGDNTFGQLGFTPGTPPYQSTPHLVF